VVGRDDAPVACLVLVLEQSLPGELLAAADDPRQPPVVQADAMEPTRLASIGKADALSAHCRVTRPERGQAEGSILAGVILVADPDRRLLEQGDHRPEHLVASETRQAEIGRDLASEARQGPTERAEPVALRRVPAGAIGLVGAVLALCPANPA